MAQPYLAMIIPVTHEGGSLPGWGGGWGSGAVDPGYGRPIFHPGHPDHGLPSPPAHPGGGPIHPIGGHPDHGLPSTPQPKAAVTEGDIPPHPEKPDPTGEGAWVLVALGNGNVGWAWMPRPGEPAQPKG